MMSLAHVRKMSRMAGAGKTVFDFTAKSLTGEEVPLDRYRGKVLLIENVASL